MTLTTAGNKQHAPGPMLQMCLGKLESVPPAAAPGAGHGAWLTLVRVWWLAQTCSFRARKDLRGGLVGAYDIAQQDAGQRADRAADDAQHACRRRQGALA